MSRTFFKKIKFFCNKNKLICLIRSLAKFFDDKFYIFVAFYYHHLHISAANLQHTRAAPPAKIQPVWF